MIFGVLDDYIDLTALWKIGVAVLLVAVIVPTAFSVAIVGEDRRQHEGGFRSVSGTLMLGIGALVVLGAIVIGLWAMTQK
jgi:hypothetical protein